MQLLQPAFHIPPDRTHFDIHRATIGRKCLTEELCRHPLPARRTGADDDPIPAAQLIMDGRMKECDVADILAIDHRKGSVTEKMWRTHIFQRMHGDIGLPGTECFEDLFGEEIRPVKGRQGHIRQPIASAAARHQFDLRIGVNPTHPISHQSRLIQTQPAMPAYDAYAVQSTPF